MMPNPRASSVGSFCKINFGRHSLARSSTGRDASKDTTLRRATFGEAARYATDRLPAAYVILASGATDSGTAEGAEVTSLPRGLHAIELFDGAEQCATGRSRVAPN